MPYIYDGVAVLAIIITLVAFVWMSIIDLKIRILPDELNIAVGVCGLIFHYATSWQYISPMQAFVGALSGGGLLLAIRAAANRYYGMDTLGLGDVKLLTAVGFWLGPENTMLAISAGAFAGLFHGILYIAYGKFIEKKDIAFRGLTIPAGPGFVVGALIIGVWFFQDLSLFSGATSVSSEYY
jgi:leader peptidase (prepilin peptidase)/N-methyltransferase